MSLYCNSIFLSFMFHKMNERHEFDVSKAKKYFKKEKKSNLHNSVTNFINIDVLMAQQEKKKRTSEKKKFLF